jgi:hypothetical protein
MKRKISKSEIFQEFDLEDLLGYAPSKRQKELFADLVIDKMVERTVEGKDINNRKFRRYTKDYAEKKGVTTSSVDLTLTGDMLNSISDKTSGKVKVEIAKDETPKAYGHISGMEGHPIIKNGKVRDFFGFKSKRQINDVLKEVDGAKSIPDNFEQSRPSVDLVELRKAMQSITIVQETNGDS